MMSLRKGSTSGKDKGGKPQQKGAAEDQGKPPDVPTEATSKAAAVTGDRSKSSSIPEEGSEHSEQTEHREEADGGESSQAQASGGCKLSKKEEEKLKQQAKAEGCRKTDARERKKRERERKKRERERKKRERETKG